MDVAEAPYSCIRIPTRVGREEVPQVGSPIAVSQGPISDKRTLNTRIHVRNCIIRIRIILTSFGTLFLADTLHTRNL